MMYIDRTEEYQAYLSGFTAAVIPELGPSGVSEETRILEAFLLGVTDGKAVLQEAGEWVEELPRSRVEFETMMTSRGLDLSVTVSTGETDDGWTTYRS